MALVNFTNLDFDQIRQSIVDYLRANSNFTDYDFEGSNLSVLIDTLAYNTYISSYNANMVSNEVFIDGATLRENVVSLARNVGYVPRSITSARANISFFVDVTGTSLSDSLTLTLKKGLVCTTQAFGAQSYVFSILDDITVSIVNGIALFDNIPIYEGTYVTSTFTFDSFNPDQRYILDNANIDTSTIRVLVKDGSNTGSPTRKFNLSTSLFGIRPNSRVFFLQEIEDQRYEIFFGDDVFGKKLSNGNVVDASYLISSGESANGINLFNFSGTIIDNNGTPVFGGISLVTVNSIASGGSEIESVSSVKRYAPRIYASQNRAVTSLDYESIVPQIYEEAQSVSVFGGEELTPPKYGKVFISIKPRVGNFLSNSLKDNIKQKLRPYAVAGIVPEILDLKYLFIEIKSNIYYNTNFAPSASFVRNAVIDNVTQYSKSTELNTYGARFKYSKFLKILDDSNESITSNITTVQIRRDLKAYLNQFASYEICYGNEFFVKNKDGYNIKSSGFRVSGVSGTVYLSDLPNTNDLTKGTIFFFKMQNDGNKVIPQIVRKNAGTIDYIKGEILLKPVNIISTEKNVGSDPIIQISVSPRSNDVIGKQELYLQLDINNSVFNMISDEMSSGSDLSGSRFITSSSYSNGDLTRL
jgi:hypothetical protein